MKQRKLTPEILDDLPALDPAAIRSRRDLALVNAIMGNYHWLAAQMAGAGHWLELGAGAGSLARHFSSHTAIKVTGVDFAPRPESWPVDWNWHQGDLFEFLRNPSSAEPTGIAACLFLHHFTNQQIGEIGKLIPESVCHLAFTEPARYTAHIIQGYTGFPLFNHVTRHDMIVSIEAGFRKNELAEALKLNQKDWKWNQTRTFWGGYRFSAQRI